MLYTHGIKTLLENDSRVVSEVGSKIYPIDAPSGTALPFITYEAVSTTVIHSKDSPEYKQSRVEVVVYAGTYALACDIGNKVRTALQRKNIKDVVRGYEIDKIFIQDEEVEHLEDPRRYAFVLEVEAFVIM
ncbi:MAG: hypothetical protein CL526_12660 [Aequorivita sp.]|nr:hypothetical protein [Aequorivita sp.]|tara:strand:- start:158 stop:550 length:393 start_codon:yes stop_codon:yes gene_type:complete